MSAKSAAGPQTPVYVWGAVTHCKCRPGAPSFLHLCRCSGQPLPTPPGTHCSFSPAEICTACTHSQIQQHPRKLRSNHPARHLSANCARASWSNPSNTDLQSGSSTSAIDTHAPVSSTYPSGHPVDCLVHPPTNSSDCKALSTEARAFWARSAASTCPACIGYPARGSRSPGALAAIARSPSTISPTSGRPVTSFRLQASQPNCTWLPQTTHNTEHKGRNGGKTHRTHTKRAQ
mmetsp:Transcript_40514/g.91133  ORF Transcript_40514/g.91133 Transcript_40514/m.91133 type:complete len:233 (+) Transcript_40514:830-1528(+)